MASETCDSLDVDQLAVGDSRQLVLFGYRSWTQCKDCWYQRIFMYPQVILLLLALIKKDRGIAPYILTLSLVGMILSGHHYWEQVDAAMQPPADPLIPCDTTGISCAKTNIHFTFGFVTIPLMALSVFVLNAVVATSLLTPDPVKRKKFFFF